MPSRNYRLYAEDILNAIRKIGFYIDGLEEHQFEQDEIVKDAVFRNLEVIGEASKHIPKSLRDQFSNIP